MWERKLAISRLSVEEFVRGLRAYTNSPLSEARYAFFLGAGCSLTSGIPAARELVRDHWLPRLRDQKAPHRLDLEAWVDEEFGGEAVSSAGSLYGTVMRHLFPLPSLRQTEVEERCAGSQPRFGYATLAALMARPEGRFNVVLTTNFDDLVADSLYLFTGARPLVIQHAALGRFIRPTRNRPLIVKLHGDHQLAPMNTDEETASLDDRLGGPVRSLLHDRGLIFVGYGGNDAGIAKFFQSLPDDALPFGVYWVSGTEPEGAMQGWLVDRTATWVDHRGFDELMVFFKDVFELASPSRQRIEEVFDAVEADYLKLSERVRSKPESGPDALALKAAVARLDASVSDWGKVELAAQRFKQSDPDRAEAIYAEGIRRLPNSVPLLGNYANFLKDRGKDDDAEFHYQRALEIDPAHPNVLAD